MLKDYLPELRQLMTPEASHLRQGHGLKPELGVPSGMSRVDVWWLARLHAVEKEPIPADSEQGWHAISLRQHPVADKACAPMSTSA